MWAGVFLFCYGYELYNIPKALRDTAIIVFITLAAVFIIAVLLFVLAAMGKSKSGASALSKTLGSSRPSSAAAVGGGGSGGVGGGWVGPLFVNTGLGTHTVTHEVVREVLVAPPAPQPITCPSCGRPYVPSENHFACPNCGAPTPPEFMEASDGTAKDNA